MTNVEEYIKARYRLSTSDQKAMLREVFSLIAFKDELPMRSGDLVEQRSETGTVLNMGIVAGPTVSRLIHAHYGFGLFVIVSDSSFSYTNEAAAVRAGWTRKAGA